MFRHAVLPCFSAQAAFHFTHQGAHALTEPHQDGNMKTTFAFGVVALLSLSHLGHACGLAALDPVALDRNGNGQISRDEAAGTALAWAFDSVDANGDGAVDQPEFGARCANYDAAGTAPVSSEVARDPTVVERVAVEKAEEQKTRAQGRIGQRVDQEANNAVDGLIDKGLGKIFGR
jgi:hypothetical protein